jgi:hypothetical protein
MFEHLDDPRPLVVGDTARRGVAATVQSIRMRRRIAGIGTTSLLTLIVALVAMRGIDTDGTSQVTASAPERPSATAEETSPSSMPTGAPATTGVPATTATTVRTASTTSTTVTTTTVAAPRQVVKRCQDAEPDRPSLLFVHFLSKPDGSSWEYKEVRELVTRAGGSTAYLDRLGEQDWSSFTPGEASMTGGRAELERVADRLSAIARDNGWNVDTELRCASEDPDGRFAEDRFTVQVREGTDSQALLSRHHGLETEEGRQVSWNGKSTYLRLKTSRPAQLFERVLEWWNDPDVLLVQYSYSGGGPAG